MAYTHSQYEVELNPISAGTYTSVASTGDKATWAPTYMPHRVRACSFVITTQCTVTQPVVNFTTRATAGSNTGISAGDIAILKLPIADVPGTAPWVIFKDGIQAKVAVGKEVVFNVGTAGSAGAGIPGMLVEPEWETPANNTAQAATT